MARAIWKGHIAFGLVNIPVTLFSAEKNIDLDFNLLDSRDQARIRYQRVNDVTGDEVPWDQIVRGYEYSDGQYVVLDEEDFEQAAVEATKTVEIEAFVDRDEIDDILFDKPYYLVPRDKGAKSYVLLRNTLQEADKVGIARVVIRTREHLSALLPRGQALFLILMRYIQEVRPPDEFDLPGEGLAEFDISKKEQKLARQLVDAMSESWDPGGYHDEYRAALMSWIEKRVEAGELKESPSAELPDDQPPATDPIDITEVLQRSVAEVEG